MYNLPEMHGNNAAFWAALRIELIRQGLRDLPDAPDFERKPVPPTIEPDTLLTQVCGWPLQTIYAGQAMMLATPVYAAEFCDGPSHSGIFVVHRQSRFESIADLRGCDFVFNSVHSNSGMNLPRRTIADLAGGQRFFASCVETHSQPGNLEVVSRGEADATCVDCVTYAFFTRHRPSLAQHLRILGPTRPSPAIPFVTASATAPERRAILTEALFRVGRSPEWAEVRAGLLLRNIVPAEPAGYRVLCEYEREAAELGYAELL